MTIKIFGGSHLIHEFTKQYDGHYLGVLHVMDPSTCEDTIINRDVYTIRRLARLIGRMRKAGYPIWYIQQTRKEIRYTYT